MNDSFLICDPSGPYTIDQKTGKVSIRRNAMILPWFAYAGALFVGVGTAVDASAWWWAIPLFIIGAVVGFFAGIILSLPVIGMSLAFQAVVDARRGRPHSLELDDQQSQAWRLCLLAWNIAKMGSWRDKTVDPERRVASITWSAVERAVHVERQHADAVRALDHAALQALAADTIENVERERRSLDAVETNLRKVLDTGRSIDAARARVEKERAEEQELLGRLTGGRSRRIPNSDVSNVAADRSAGLAAEAEAIAGWLAESDRMLRDL